MSAALACVLISVFVQGKETAEEEDEVAVGMEKGFMDEFFEQVGFLNAPDCFYFCPSLTFPSTLSGLTEFTQHKQTKPSDVFFRLSKLGLYI